MIYPEPEKGGRGKKSDATKGRRTASLCESRDVGSVIGCREGLGTGIVARPFAAITKRDRPCNVGGTVS